MKEKYNLLKSRKQFIIRNTLKKNAIIILLLLAILHRVCAVIGIEEAIKVQNMEVGDKRSLLGIHPNGGLSPVNMYIAWKCDYLQNLWRYSVYAEETNRLEKDGDEEKGFSLFSRKKHSSVSLDGENLTYLQYFTRQLKNMFYFENDRIFLKSSSYSSFFHLLQTYMDSQISLRILAALFLLSEGVNLPINVKNDPKIGKSLVLRKKKDNGFHINLYMSLKCGSSHPKDFIYQKRTEEIVDFFKATAPGSSLKVPKKYLLPTTHEDFLTGNFLFNPRFLIQSYFFEYIDSAEMYEEFVRVVYEMLNDYLPDQDNTQKATDVESQAFQVFYSLFIEKNYILLNAAPENINKIHSIRPIWSDKPTSIPFLVKGVQAPCSFIPSYLRSSECVDMTEDSYIEHTLLDLFFCFTFNHYINGHNPSHLPSPLSELKAFLTEYWHPVYTTTYTLHNDWCKVVRAANNSASANISYTEDKKQIEFGLLNILYAIKGLAGTNKELDHAITCLSGIIKKGLVEKPDQAVIQDVLQNAFKSLSENKNIKVECSHFKIEKSESGRADIFTECNTPIVITYSEYPFHSYRQLEIEIPFITSTSASSANKDKNFDVMQNKQELEKMQKAYSVPENYNEYIICQYIDNEMDRLSRILGTECVHSRRIHSILLNGSYEAMNGLLVYGSLRDIQYMSKIIEVFLIHTSGKAFAMTDHMVQFTSWLIYSVKLDDKRVRQAIMSSCIYNENYLYYYSKIEYDAEDLLDVYKSAAGIRALVRPLFSFDSSILSIAHSCESLCSLMRQSVERYAFFGGAHLCENVIERASKAETEEGMINEITSFLYTVKKCVSVSGDYCAANVFLGWIMHIVQRCEQTPLVIAMAIYDCIDAGSLTVGVKVLIPPTCLESAAKSTCALLEDNKEELLNGSGDISTKTNKYFCILKFVQSLC
ncbi:hypothetical protein NEIG_02341 [Nematocida sp. ERTm5]|nr:hypothetical protein NEIG_02341 [Nematocida sp. ERTm5]